MISGSVSIDDLDSWEGSGRMWCDNIRPPKDLGQMYNVSPEINKLVSLWHYGDPSRLRVDAVVNRLNSDMKSGGLIFQSLKIKAGDDLVKACQEIGTCALNGTVVTPGFNLPSKAIIHTIGPATSEPADLEEIMKSILARIDGVSIRSVGIPAFFIENRVFGLPHALQIVFQVLREFLEIEENRTKVDRIILIASLQPNIPFYVKLLYVYFPIHGINDLVSQQESEEEDSELTDDMFGEIDNDENSSQSTDFEIPGSEPETSSSDHSLSFSSSLVV